MAILKPKPARLSPVRKVLLAIAIVVGAVYAVIFLGFMLVAIMAF